MSRRHPVFIVTVMWLLSCMLASAEAATRRVPSQFPTIAAAISGLAPGDSILLAPGTYYETDLLIGTIPDPGFVLTSEAGPEQTFIDGTGAGLSEMLAILDAAPATEVSGITFQNGSFGIRVGGGSPKIIRNRFRGFVSTAIRLRGDVDALIAENLFVENGSGLDMRSRAEVLRNTFVGQRSGAIGIDLAAGSPAVVIRNNILVRNFGGIANYQFMYVPELICNDVWGSTYADYFNLPDPTGQNGNISVDPLFCDYESGDLTLDGVSPCMPGHHPNGAPCGLIGALDYGCGDPTATEATTWGRLRLLLSR